jgi:hypothetical protein
MPPMPPPSYETVVGGDYQPSQVMLWVRVRVKVGGNVRVGVGVKVWSSLYSVYGIFM